MFTKQTNLFFANFVHAFGNALREIALNDPDFAEEGEKLRAQQLQARQAEAERRRQIYEKPKIKREWADIARMLRQLRRKSDREDIARRISLLRVGQFFANVERVKFFWDNIYALCAEILVVEKKLKRARGGARKQNKDAINFLEIQKTNTFLKIRET